MTFSFWNKIKLKKKLIEMKCALTNEHILNSYGEKNATTPGKIIKIEL